MQQYFSKEGRADYAPPILGNGEMSLALDFMGTQSFQVTELDEVKDEANCAQDKNDHWNNRNFASNNVWWSGRRYIDSIRRTLIPFGQLHQRIEGLAERPAEWNQTLDTEGARLMSESIYENGEVLHVESFLHHDMNLVAIRRRLDAQGKRSFSFDYKLTEKEQPEEFLFPRYMQVKPAVDELTGGWKIDYNINGQKLYRGVIRFFADRPLKAVQSGNVFSLEGEMDGGDITLYLLLRDNLNEADYDAVSRRQAISVLQGGYDKLYQSHLAKWQTYYAESHVQLADENLMRVYRATLYDLKCFTTPWSIPVGLNDSQWEGKFFAYDEYFSFIGLLTGNHRDLAGRVPRFRRAGLEYAIKRASSKYVCEAHYPWETVETGEEAAIQGYWYEHIFHMSNISLGAWEYYLYTADVDYLRETAYPMMRACSEFFLRHMIYHIEGGKVIIGRCTDWERMGSSVQNPYMTTCSVIRTLTVSAEAAEKLGVEPEFVENARKYASLLFRDLPNDGVKYIPHPDCGEQKSIGVFGGMFPYQVMDENNPMQRAAIEDYTLNGAAYGNMYAVGGGLSSWFAAWKGASLARMHEADDAMLCLRQAAASQGCFGELFEINEAHCIYRPWFTTANGMFMETVHSVLLQSHEGVIDVLPAYPQKEGDVCFDLPAEGDLMVHVRVAYGKLTELSFKKGALCPLSELTVKLPKWLCADTAQLDEGGFAVRFA